MIGNSGGCVTLSARDTACCIVRLLVQVASDVSDANPFFPLLSKLRNLLRFLAPPKVLSDWLDAQIVGP